VGGGGGGGWKGQRSLNDFFFPLMMNGFLRWSTRNEGRVEEMKFKSDPIMPLHEAAQ
jgi:hypothetical protein